MPTLAAGDTFDRYTIEALLGRGGMGEVYRAFDPKLGRRIALKVDARVRALRGGDVAHRGRARLARVVARESMARTPRRRAKPSALGLIAIARRAGER